MYRLSSLVSCWCLEKNTQYSNILISIKIPVELSNLEVRAYWILKRFWRVLPSHAILCSSPTDFWRQQIYLNAFPCLLRSSGVRPLWFFSWSVLHPVLCSSVQHTSTPPLSAATWSAVAPCWSTASTAHLWHTKQGVETHKLLKSSHIHIGPSFTKAGFH